MSDDLGRCPFCKSSQGETYNFELMDDPQGPSTVDGGNPIGACVECKVCSATGPIAFLDGKHMDMFTRAIDMWERGSRWVW